MFPETSLTHTQVNQDEGEMSGSKLLCNIFPTMAGIV